MRTAPNLLTKARQKCKKLPTENKIKDAMKVLSVGESYVVPRVSSKPYFHPSGLWLEQGKTYRFAPDKTQTWKDWFEVCDAGGWDHWRMTPFRWAKRFSGANWCSMIGSIKAGEDGEVWCFEIGKGPTEKKAKISGEFCPFANDAYGFYWNNEGGIDVNVTCLF